MIEQFYKVTSLPRHQMEHFEHSSIYDHYSYSSISQLLSLNTYPMPSIRNMFLQQSPNHHLKTKQAHTIGMIIRLRIIYRYIRSSIEQRIDMMFSIDMISSVEICCIDCSFVITRFNRIRIGIAEISDEKSMLTFL